MEPETDSDEGLAGLLDRALNRGAILQADLLITVNDIPLIAVRLQAAIANIELMVKYGLMTDWDAVTRYVDEEYLDEVLEGSDSENDGGECESAEDRPVNEASLPDT